MSSKQESWDRLRAEKWCETPWIASKNDQSAKFQKLSEGVGPYVYDEYAVVIDGMPSALTAESYLKEMALAPNGAVNHGAFDAINVFIKRMKSSVAIGDIYDIDIAGPENGSIVLVALSAGFGVSTVSSWFDIQTIECDKYGSHPECGAREFGYEYTSGGVKFYTRGVSRPSNIAMMAGAAPQLLGWTAMMKGISESIRRRGGTPRENSFTAEKVSKPF
jgi:hypothetical protein